MKSFNPGHWALVLSLFLSIGLLPASAQTVSTIPADETVQQLSTFEVRSRKDSAYVADKSVATTGFAAELSKIPLAIGVVTSQFLEDTGGVGFNGVANYQAAFTTDQGGMDNGAGDYWIVRNSDAHAWAEVWLEGQGWVRVDPTAAVAGYGMRSIRESISKLGGRMDIDSSEGLGSRITITLPTRRWRP